MAKEETFEQAQVRLAEAKTKRAEANDAMDAFRKANSIKKGTKSDEITDKTIKKDYQALQKTQKEARAAVEDAENAVKALKPKSTRVTNYTYPEDCVTPEDKKRFRAKSRATAKAGDKPAKEPKAPKEEKKAKKVEEPAAKEKKAEKPAEKSKDKKVKKSED